MWCDASSVLGPMNAGRTGMRPEHVSHPHDSVVAKQILSICLIDVTMGKCSHHPLSVLPSLPLSVCAFRFLIIYYLFLLKLNLRVLFVSLQQMLLKLVKRLASLQHQQQPSNTNQIIDELVNSGSSDQANDNDNGTANSISSSRDLVARLGTNNNGVDSNNNNNNHINNGGGVSVSNNSSKKRFFTNNIINNTNYQRVYQDGSDKIDCITTSLTSSYPNKIGSNHANALNVTPNNQPANNMGSNVSRHSGKGLSGRRTQSSGLFRPHYTHTHTHYTLALSIQSMLVSSRCHRQHCASHIIIIFHFSCKRVASHTRHISAYSAHTPTSHDTLHGRSCGYIIIKMESTFRTKPILIIASLFP